MVVVAQVKVLLQERLGNLMELYIQAVVVVVLEEVEEALVAAVPGGGGIRGKPVQQPLPPCG